jgi:8-oxo-dGTP diphosphatase
MNDANLILTVAAVIEDGDGRVLLVRKRDSSILIQPGGKRDPGESSLATLRRELREELGVELDEDGVHRLGEFEDVAVHETGRRVRTEAFVVRVRGVPAPRAEIEELAWVAAQAPFPASVAPLSANHILPAFARHRAGG